MQPPALQRYFVDFLKLIAIAHENTLLTGCPVKRVHFITDTAVSFIHE